MQAYAPSSLANINSSVIEKFMVKYTYIFIVKEREYGNY